MACASPRPAPLSPQAAQPAVTKKVFFDLEIDGEAAGERTRRQAQQRFLPAPTWLGCDLRRP